MPLMAAALQMTSREDVGANLACAASLIARAAARGAALCVLPENFAILGRSEEDKLAHVEDVDPHGRPGPIVAAMSEAARRHQVWLVLGGLPERGPDPRHVFNTCVVLDPQGAIQAVYRKVHLFDVRTPDGMEYRESRSVAPGNAPLVVDTPWGGLGLSICYDLRFPELYRRLADMGATIVVVPSAFTVETGRDHWHVLLRARAIENQTFVIAAAQYGRHNERRVTYGRSLIVDPWGTVLAEAADGEGMALAELDLARQREIRAQLPVLTHRRL